MTNRRINILTLVFFAFFVASAQLAFSQNKKIAEEVQRLTSDSQLKHASIAVSVYNISQGKEEYSFDADRLLTPASLVKIFTTAAGFELLGKDYRFKTLMGYMGSITPDGVLNGDLVLIGGGDPLLGSYRYRQTSMDSLFRMWFKAIKKAGILSVNGRVVCDASTYDGPQLHDTWLWGDVGNYYGCGASGFNFHENMYFVFFNPDSREGAPASIDHLLPKGIDVRPQNKVTTGPANSGDQVVIYGTPTSSTRYYSGTVPLGSKQFKVRGALPNPGKTCAELFSVYLNKNGLKVTSPASEIECDAQKATILFDYYSVPYTILSQYTNMTSNNLYAESIFKQLGREAFGKGSFQNGTKAVNKFFSKHGLDMDAVHVVDGSGLSRNNLATARFFTSLLAEVAKTEYYTDFRNTLPKVGESGTARNLLSGTMPSNTEMFVKTGTMTGVTSYAGYAMRANGDKLCFSLIVNNQMVSSSYLKPKIARVLQAILESN